MDELQALLAFCSEMEKMKTIERKNLLADGQTPEDDAQHSWHLAVMAIALHRYAQPGVDLARVVNMLLVHDVVEIDAGDAYAYDAQANVGKHEREEQAAERIFGLLPQPEGQGMRALWEEFEQGESPEAVYANALDRLQPLLNHYQNRGVVWKRNGITREQVYERNKFAQQAFPQLWPMVQDLIEQAHQNGWLK